MKEPPLCKLSLSKYYSCSNYSIRYIHLPSRKFEFQEPEFLGKNFFPILPLSKIDSVAEISIYLIYYLYISTSDNIKIISNQNTYVLRGIKYYPYLGYYTIRNDSIKIARIGRWMKILVSIKITHDFRREAEFHNFAKGNRRRACIYASVCACVCVGIRGRGRSSILAPETVYHSRSEKCSGSIQFSLLLGSR